MRIQDIKDKLRNNIDLLINILEKLGCHKLNTSFKNELRGAVPGGNTTTSLQVVLDDNLTCNIYSRADYPGGDIFALIQFFNGYNFMKSLIWVCKELNLNYDNLDYIESEVYKYLKKYKLKNKIHDLTESIILDETILHRYKKIPIESWRKEGVNDITQLKYQVMYNPKDNRIVFPIRDEIGRLLSIKGRTQYPNYDELGIPKFIYYYPVKNNKLLFGLYHNKQYIKEENEIIITEAEKSVMKFDSLGIFNAVSVGTNKILDSQLEKILSLQCKNLIIAFDKDVSYKNLVNEAKKANRYINVYIIHDKDNLLNVKDAPIDCGIDVWKELYENKIKIV